MATNAVAQHANGIVNGDDAFKKLTSILSSRSHDFLRPSQEFQEIAIQAAKAVLDPLASDIADAQSTRRNENRKKRKREDSKEEEPVLQLRQVYTKGFDVKQVWEQAKRVLDAACYEIEREVEVLGSHQSEVDEKDGRDLDEDETGISEDDVLDDEDLEQDGSDDEEMEDLDNLEEEAGSEQSELDDDEREDRMKDLEDIEAASELEDLDEEEDENSIEGKGIFVQDKHGLNDGFFSIDDFNKQSQFLEQLDVRGDGDNPSDEEEIDWDADPLATVFTKPRSGNARPPQDDSEEEEEDDDEEAGPTFGNGNIGGDESDDETNMLDEDGEGLDDSMGLSNANEIRYADFFEPPPKKPSKTKRMRALPKTQPEPRSKSGQANEDDDQVQNDIERAIADVRRDLLDSDDEDDALSGEEDDEQSDDFGKSKRTKPSGKNLSTHEKQRAAIAAEIRQLEAANVAKRDWQLSGEARAADRPLNSLIEEDLEFERAGKPVPVVTAETSEQIEQLIKRRILAREFDEVIRRLPGSNNIGNDVKRGRVEVDDQKATVGLGEIYEQEHLRTSDPSNYVDKRSAATKKQHEQINILWKEVRDQLDALSNLHFKPKRVDVQMKTVEDKPRIAMEDARPVGDLEAGEGGMLAPQEVYKPGLDTKTGGNEIVVGKTGASLNRDEMSREEKLRRRRREKERSKKAGTNQPQISSNNSRSKNNTGKKTKSDAKADIISDLKKGNVKVIGKGGDLQKIENSKKGRGDHGQLVVSNLKL